MLHDQFSRLHFADARWLVRGRFAGTQRFNRWEREV
jgi:hypothetical protein